MSDIFPDGFSPEKLLDSGKIVTETYAVYIDAIVTSILVQKGKNYTSQELSWLWRIEFGF